MSWVAATTDQVRYESHCVVEEKKGVAPTDLGERSKQFRHGRQGGGLRRRPTVVGTIHTE
jgi:hypothetical protein